MVQIGGLSDRRADHLMGGFGIQHSQLKLAEYVFILVLVRRVRYTLHMQRVRPGVIMTTSSTGSPKVELQNLAIKASILHSHGRPSGSDGRLTFSSASSFRKAVKKRRERSERHV